MVFMRKLKTARGESAIEIAYKNKGHILPVGICSLTTSRPPHAEDFTRLTHMDNP